jgi:Glucodextranase, domain N
MTNLSAPRLAPGGPGIEPRWTRCAKVAVGTAYSTSSRVWYTLDQGCITEVYYPTIDSLQIRDLQFLVTDGVRLAVTRQDFTERTPLTGSERAEVLTQQREPADVPVVLGRRDGRLQQYANRAFHTAFRHSYE